MFINYRIGGIHGCSGTGERWKTGECTIALSAGIPAGLPGTRLSRHPCRVWDFLAELQEILGFTGPYFQKTLETLLTNALYYPHKGIYTRQYRAF